MLNSRGKQPRAKLNYVQATRRFFSGQAVMWLEGLYPAIKQKMKDVTQRFPFTTADTTVARLDEYRHAKGTPVRAYATRPLRRCLDSRPPELSS
ncbi:MAG TPA: hypothetical protein VHV54_17580 [Candidatus Binatia bacterium]|nr:hypothetical protein [Candidatus Binatia bacterium]